MTSHIHIYMVVVEWYYASEANRRKPNRTEPMAVLMHIRMHSYHDQARICFCRGSDHRPWVLASNFTHLIYSVVHGWFIYVKLETRRERKVRAYRWKFLPETTAGRRHASLAWRGAICELCADEMKLSKSDVTLLSVFLKHANPANSVDSPCAIIPPTLIPTTPFSS